MMLALLSIELIKVKRNLGVFLLSIGMPVIFFLIFSSTGQFPDPKIQAEFTQSYMLTMTSFSMSGFALFTFPTMILEDKKNNWFIFIKHSPLPLATYYLSKLFRVFLCFVSAIIIVFLTGAVVRGVDMAATKWLFSALLLLLTSGMYLILGLLLSHIKSEQTLSVFANLLYFALAILGGSWMPITLFPKWLQDICRLTPSYHVNNLVVTYAKDGSLVGKSLFFVLIYAIIFLGMAMFCHKIKEKSA